MTCTFSRSRRRRPHGTPGTITHDPGGPCLSAAAAGELHLGEARYLTRVLPMHSSRMPADQRGTNDQRRYAGAELDFRRQDSAVRVLKAGAATEYGVISLKTSNAGNGKSIETGCGI